MSWEHFDKICEKITADIIEAIEDQRFSFADMWCKYGIPMNGSSKRPYRGFNSVYLGFVTNEHRYRYPYFLTYKQAQQLGGTVKKGETGYPVIYWKKYPKGQSVKAGEDDEHEGTEHVQVKMFPFHYTVFNLDQTEGVEVELPESKIRKAVNTIDSCEKIVNSYENGPEIVSKQKERAFYAPALDKVNMPDQEQFVSDEYYYQVLFHELIHSTGHKSRLKRFEEYHSTAFGSKDYSKEELVAELGASFLSYQAGIAESTFKNSVAYLQGWVRKFKDQPRMLITASNQAMKACERIMRGKNSEQETTESI